MTQYRYQLERYRGRSTRHVCPQCGRKNVFTRYIDTYNNIYINDIVGKCNRLDKCGYHYTPHQYFTDNPWKRDNSPGEGGSLRPWKRDAPRKKECSFIHFYRENERMNSTPPPPPEPTKRCAGLPRRVLDATMSQNSQYLTWQHTQHNVIQRSEATWESHPFYRASLKHIIPFSFWHLPQ